MRVLVFLLVLANLLFLVWTQGYLDTGREPDALRLQHQLSPEKMKIVARDEPPTASPAASTPNAPNAPLQLTHFCTYVSKPGREEEGSLLHLCQ